MDTVADRINDCRNLYREGRYRQAIVVARRALDEIDEGGSLTADASDVEYGLDAATLLGLIQRGLGDDAAAWATLAGVFPRRCPEGADPSAVVAGIRDDERQRNIVFGQMMLFELGAEYLLEEAALRYQLQWCRTMAEASRVPLLVLHVQYLEAWMARIEQRPHDAIARWTSHADAVRRQLPAASLPAGYPAARSLCQAALTAEALGDARALDEVLIRAREPSHRLRLWEAAIFDGIVARRSRGPMRPAAQLPDDDGDAELGRLLAERWLWQLDDPTEADIECVRVRVGTRPPAVVVGIVARLLRSPSRFEPRALEAARRWLDDSLRAPPLLRRGGRLPEGSLAVSRMSGGELASLLAI